MSKKKKKLKPTMAPKARVIAVGDKYESRSGKVYTLTELRTDGGFKATRTATKSVVVITGQKLTDGQALLDSQGFAICQRNPKDGGFSYTVAVDASIAWYLNCTAVGKKWVQV